jgi:hypothetical protein
LTIFLRLDTLSTMVECTRRKYPTEAAAKKAIWAMRLNRKGFADEITPRYCPTCKAWHTVRKDS